MANDAETLASGKPKRIARRGKNKIIGRKLASKLFRLFFLREGGKMETLLEKTKIGDTMSIGAQKEGDELGLFIANPEKFTCRTLRSPFVLKE